MKTPTNQLIKTCLYYNHSVSILVNFMNGWNSKTMNNANRSLFERSISRYQFTSTLVVRSIFLVGCSYIYENYMQNKYLQVLLLLHHHITQPWLKSIHNASCRCLEIVSPGRDNGVAVLRLSRRDETMANWRCG